MSDSVLYSVDVRGIATVTLNRPEKHNAFDGPLLAALHRALQTAAADRAVRAVVLTGASKSFCSGADLAAMRALMDASGEENLRDALQLTRLLKALNALCKPTVARVNGNAFGGAVGLIACCDIAIASRDARFGLTEVRLGLAPAAISPYVVAAIGVRQSRRYFQTAELMDADTAQRLGLLHESVAPEELDARIESVIDALLKGGPQALREAKELVAEVAGCHGQPDDRLQESTAQRLARLRISEEGQEGMKAFLDKRPAGWLGSAKGKAR